MDDSRSHDHVLVLGGTGFVGSSVVRELRAADRKVTVVARRLDRAEELRAVGVRLELTASVASGLGQDPPGHLPAPLAGALLGAPLISSLTSSFRIENIKAREQLDWRPTHSSILEGLPRTLAALRR